MHPDELLSALNERCHLYRLFGDAGRLLYIGIAVDPRARFRAHRAEKGWWPEVVDVAIEEHPDRATAEAAERAAIKAEHPAYNHMHNLSSARPATVPALDEDPEIQALRAEADVARAAFAATGEAGPERRDAALRAVQAQAALYRALERRVQDKQVKMRAAILAASHAVSQLEMARLTGFSRNHISSILRRER